MMGLYLLAMTWIVFAWAYVLLLHKAGRSAWWAALLFISGPLGLLWLGLTTWPIEHELSWRRLQDGEHTEDDTARLEERAIDRERRGDSEQARAIFEELERRAPNAAGKQYYQNCLERLDEDMKMAGPS